MAHENVHVHLIVDAFINPVIDDKKYMKLT